MITLTGEWKTVSTARPASVVRERGFAGLLGA
ncbi:hypothetical protein PSET11_00026 [Arthrobacter ulcerisalmonis]|uniref:Uncharacterized protein n=1 Tax=Arthrobacter ulcerisalmonis TaxID=2483813 RepID=A0A3P5W9X7_9MICC|nr:hypothetical protein PSET11_00026 [Arthrobacter ulcerisalmonis]